MTKHAFTQTFLLHTDTLGTRIGIIGILASIAMAGATWWMAYKTRELAKDTHAAIQVAREQAAAARDGVTAITRPWIVVDEDQPNDDPFFSGGGLISPAIEVTRGLPDKHSVLVRARLRNIGPGLAIFDMRNSWVSGFSQTEPKSVRSAYGNLYSKTPVVPSGAEFTVEARVWFKSNTWSNLTVEEFCFLPTPDGGLTPTGIFLLEVAYSDAGGGNEVVAVITVQVEQTLLRCNAVQVEYKRGNPLELFAITQLPPQHWVEQ